MDLCRAEINIRPWRSMVKKIKEGNKKTKWEERVPYAYWKGNPHVCPWRGDLIKCNVSQQNDWNARLYAQVQIPSHFLHKLIKILYHYCFCFRIGTQRADKDSSTPILKTSAHTGILFYI